MRKTRPFQAFLLAVGMLATGSCGQEPAGNAPDLAADTASLPETDIYLAPLHISDEGVEVGAFRAIAATSGYDNQPSFLPGEAALLFVSEGDSGKTDIWRYDIETDEKTRVFSSPSVSEFSPKAAPVNYGVSYIQENESGDVTRVHHMPAGGGPGEPVVAFAPLGYYAWLKGGASLAVYLRGEPAELHLVDVASGETHRIIGNIGRGLLAAPDGRALYFTAATPGGGYRVMFLSLADETPTPLIDLPGGGEDFAVVFSKDDAARGFFAGDGASLRFTMAENAQWTTASDLSAYGVTHVTRVAVSGDGAWIAVVTDAS